MRTLVKKLLNFSCAPGSPEPVCRQSSVVRDNLGQRQGSFEQSYPSDCLDRLCRFCSSGRDARYGDFDSQLAPPTGPTRCNFLNQIGTPGHVCCTCPMRFVILLCHQRILSCLRGISVESFETRSCRPKKARSQTVRSGEVSLGSEGSKRISRTHDPSAERCMREDEAADRCEL